MYLPVTWVNSVIFIVCFVTGVSRIWFSTGNRVISFSSKELGGSANRITNLLLIYVFTSLFVIEVKKFSFDLSFCENCCANCHTMHLPLHLTLFACPVHIFLVAGSPGCWHSPGISLGRGVLAAVAPGLAQVTSATQWALSGSLISWCNSTSTHSRATGYRVQLSTLDHTITSCSGPELGTAGSYPLWQVQTPWLDACTKAGACLIKIRLMSQGFLVPQNLRSLAGLLSVLTSN